MLNADQSSTLDFSELHICVFGGGNGWGKRIAETMASAGGRVLIIEKDDGADAALAAINESDVVFIAIPDADIDALLQKFHVPLRSKTLLDCATNKSGFGATLQQLAEDGASVCSTHPMAASGGELLGQNALIMPLGRNSAQAERLARGIYGRLGMLCRALPFEQHTALMAAVQMLPHVIQRLFIDTLGHGLLKLDIGIGELDALASANYLLAELGLGRVAAQRAGISAGIVETALRDRFGSELMDVLRQSLQRIRQAGHSRAELEALFDAGTRRLDPDGSWRTAMAGKSEAALIRLGNLRSRTLTIEAPNRIGMLRDILSVLAGHGIDMTALDSRLVKADDGSERVFFDIAISNEQVPREAITGQLALIDVRFND